MRRSYAPSSGQMLSDSNNELFDFVKAWVATSLAFGIVLSGGFAGLFTLNFLLNLLIAAVTCGIGFVVHELAHRVVARNFGTDAHFVASNDAILFMPVLFALAGFFLAAPGAVWHRSLSLRENGLIAIAGPISNLVLAALFFGLTLVLPPWSFWYIAVWIGYRINAFLGLFNMIPADPFDGGKVWRWNKIAFGVTAAIGLFMVFG